MCIITRSSISRQIFSYIRNPTRCVYKTRKITWVLEIELSHFPWAWWEFVSSQQLQTRHWGSLQLKFIIPDLRHTSETAALNFPFPLAKPELPQITHRNISFRLERKPKKVPRTARGKQWFIVYFSPTKIKSCNSVRHFNTQFLFVLVTFNHKWTIFEHCAYTEMTNTHAWLDLHLQIESDKNTVFTAQILPLFSIKMIHAHYSSINTSDLKHVVLPIDRLKPFCKCSPSNNRTLLFWAAV